MVNLVMQIIIVGQAGNRHQPVSAIIIEGDEQAKAGHTGNPGGEFGPDPLGEKQGHGPIDRFAFGGGGTALGGGNMLAPFGITGHSIAGQTALAQPRCTSRSA